MPRPEDYSLHSAPANSDHLWDTDVDVVEPCAGGAKGRVAMSEQRDVRVVVFQENGYWIAQCLELNIGAQAKDIETLKDRLIKTVKIECAESLKAHGEPFAHIGQAPTSFYQKWEERSASPSSMTRSLVETDCERINLIWA